MTLFSHGVPPFFRPRQERIKSVNVGLSYSNISEGFATPSLSIGMPAVSNRFAIVAATQDDNAARLNSMLWGSTVLTRRARGECTSDGALGQGTADIWGGFIPGTEGLSASLSFPDFSGDTTMLNLGITTFVTNVIDSPTPIDAGGVGVDILDDPTINNLATADQGFVIAVVQSLAESVDVTAMSGNGSTGAFTEVFNATLGSQQLHGVYLKDLTAAGTNEDFTATISSPSGGDFDEATCMAMASFR